MTPSLTYSLSPEEYASAVLLRSRHIPVAWGYKAVAVAAYVIFFACIGYLAAASWSHRNVPAPAVKAAIATMVVALLVRHFLLSYVQRRILMRGTHFRAPRSVFVEPEGIRHSSADMEQLHRWSGFSGVEILGGYVFLHLDPLTFFPIPLARFGSPAEAEAFVADVRARLDAGRIPGTERFAHVETAPLESPGGSPQAGRRADVVDTVLDAMRLALLLPLQASRPRSSWRAVLVLGLSSLAVPVVYSFLTIGPQGDFSWQSLSSAAFHIPLMLAAAIALAYSVKAPETVPRFMVAALLISIVIDVVTFALTSAFGTRREVLGFLAWASPAWLAIALAGFAFRFVEPGGRRLAAALSCAALLAWPLSTTYRDRGMWHEPYDNDADSQASPLSPTSEDVLYRQPKLLAQQLDTVRAGRKGVVDVFFIGMAGWGPQDVFRKEVDAVSTLMRERFDAEGRVIRLVNNRGTLLDTPIASETALRAALAKVAEKMDKDEDVLVLYMTSHGSEDHRFALSLWPVQFNTIDPATVRTLLDESGIRNRVVIVSACYSGGFVKPLEGADTLVITASAADRNSFGCSNEADWTYFGKAYFDDALRNTHSFTNAFAEAKPRIAAREKLGKFEGSDPQISAGPGIAATLTRLAAQLDGVTPTAGGRVAAAAPAAADIYREYAEAMYSGDYIAELRQACVASLALSGPDEAAVQYPGVFGGLEKSPKHWSRMKRAWQAYSDELCAKGADKALLRGAYEKKLREVVSLEDVASALKFIHTPQGAKWFRGEREAVRQQQLEVARLQADLGTALYKRYLDEQAKIFADYRKAS